MLDNLKQLPCLVAVSVKIIMALYKILKKFSPVLPAGDESKDREEKGTGDQGGGEFSGNVDRKALPMTPLPQSLLELLPYLDALLLSERPGEQFLFGEPKISRMSSFFP